MPFSLTHLFGDYYYITDPTDPDEPGSVVVEDDGGDTLLPPWQGTYSHLEVASSEDEAMRIARAWDAGSR